MKKLWAPWRIQYIKTLEKEKGCIFCIKPKEKRDEENFILKRGKKCFIILNKFPYNSGHLMIAPYRHTGKIENLKDEESLEIFNFLKLSIKALKKSIKPHGFNIGINIGKIAGAGYPGHVHLHVVPRWGGDTNFMPVIGETKIIPEEIERTFKILYPFFNEENKG
ncbi:MAG: HIT domain-containing protein [candidate division WOR-3 bacterium]